MHLSTPRITALLFIVGIVTLGIHGCSGERPAGDDDPAVDAAPEPDAPPSLAIEAYFDGLFEFHCSSDECQPGIDATVFGTVEECKTKIAEFYGVPAGEALPRGISEGLAAGRIIYDAAAADACLAGLDALACTDRWYVYGTVSSPSEQVAACAAVVQGTVPIGETCYSGDDCDGAGQTSICEFSADGCSGVCVALPAVGETCGPPESPYQGCALGTYCAPDSSTCQPRTADGGACTGHDECRVGHGCFDSVCGPPVATVSSGAACVANFQCPEFDQPLGEACTGEGTDDPPYRCQPRIAENQVCNPENSSLCQLGTVCTDAGAGPVCVAIPDDGESCAITGFCNGFFTGHWCDEASICRPPGAAGEACGVPSPFATNCQPGLACVAGICEPLRAAGASCDSDSVCESGSCGADGACAAVCMAPSSASPGSSRQELRESVVRILGNGETMTLEARSSRR